MPLPTGTITFLFSDIERSTARWEAHREAMQAALRRHDELMHVTIARHGGHVFKTVGDEFCAAFSRPADAVSASLDAQQSIAAEDWSDVDGLRVRMALHSGVADERDGDYFGPTVNRVARLLSAGHGEQILVSHVTAQLLNGHLPEQASLRKLGAHRFKDLPQPETVYQLVVPGLRDAFPPLRTEAERRSNLPPELTTFTGRDAEIAQIERFTRNDRLVTLTGAGGVGKTRAALRVAATSIDAFEDGTWFVPLAEVADADGVAAAVGAVFGVERFSGESPAIDAVAAAIGSKKALIVLDNCEHVVAAAAATVEQLVRRCNDLHVLATSREALRVTGERAYRLGPLEEPAAVKLFTDRANAVRSAFTLDARNEPFIRSIVRRLDGIPLAIELAASRVAILGVEQIDKRLDERFKLLSGGARNALPRQQTLRALIGWSYDLLTDEERAFLRLLAIFRSGWTLDAAAAVCDDVRFPEWDAFSLLASLSEKSLVVAEQEAGDPRFRLLESTREFALERLREDGGYHDAASRHCAYYLGVSEMLFAELWSMDSYVRNGMIRADRDNFRAAIEWAMVERHDIEAGCRLVANLSDSWAFHDMRALTVKALDTLGERPSPELRGRLLLAYIRRENDNSRTYEADLEAVSILENTGPPTAYVEASLSLGMSLARMARFDEAVVESRKALDVARELGMLRLLGHVLARSAGITQMGGDLPQALRMYREAVQIFESLGDTSASRSAALANLAEGLFASGDVDAALQYARAALEFDREESHYRTVINNNIAGYLLSAGRYAEAMPHAQAALDNAAAMGEEIPMAAALCHLAEIAAADGDCERAARLLGYTDAVYRRAGFTREPTERAGYERTLNALRRALPAERLDDLFGRGLELDRGRAVTLAQASAL